MSQWLNSSHCHLFFHVGSFFKRWVIFPHGKVFLVISLNKSLRFSFYNVEFCEIHVAVSRNLIYTDPKCVFFPVGMRTRPTLFLVCHISTNDASQEDCPSTWQFITRKDKLKLIFHCQASASLTSQQVGLAKSLERLNSGDSQSSHS